MPELDFVLYSFWLFWSLLYIATVDIVLKHKYYLVKSPLKDLSGRL